MSSWDQTQEEEYRDKRRLPLPPSSLLHNNNSSNNKMAEEKEDLHSYEGEAEELDESGEEEDDEEEEEDEEEDEASAMMASGEEGHVLHGEESGLGPNVDEGGEENGEESMLVEHNQGQNDAIDDGLAPPAIDLDELLQVMLDKEARSTRPTFWGDFLAYRRSVVEWLTQICEVVFSLSSITQHIAINYLDTCLSSLLCEPNRFLLVAAACVLIAVKHEEIDEKVPSLESLNACCRDLYAPDIICKMEVFLLNTLHWELMVVTPRHFLDLYIKRGACNIYPEQDSIGDTAILDKHALVQSYLDRFSAFFVDLAVQELHFVPNYSASIIAAASLAAARLQLKIRPVWSPHLELVTTRSFADIKPCFEGLWRAYRAYEPSFTS